MSYFPLQNLTLAELFWEWVIHVKICASSIPQVPRRLLAEVSSLRNAGCRMRRVQKGKGWRIKHQALQSFFLVVLIWDECEFSTSLPGFSLFWLETMIRSFWGGTGKKPVEEAHCCLYLPKTARPFLSLQQKSWKEIYLWIYLWIYQ